ncbi:uncharacterized protein LOC131954254 [Physella acuta]|uniref:uncharacterized protein LOC131954254 n=1 Tax=Physella acuta TaxID=109671 RepID=UPI0027DB3CCA|nr:uncharacterized protein LOC131954254 [Physella acuta]
MKNLIQILISDITAFDEKIKLVEKELKNGVDPNAVYDAYDVSAMHLAAGQGFVITELILRYGGNPNVESSEGVTPLHIAASWGDVKTLKLLFKYGAKVTQDQDGKTAYDLAVEEGHDESAKLIRQYTVNTVIRDYVLSSLADDKQHELQDQTLEYDQFQIGEDLQQPETITEQLYNFLEAGQRVYFDATSPNNIKLGSKLLQNKVGGKGDLDEAKDEDKLESFHDSNVFQETLSVNKSKLQQSNPNSNNNCKNVSLIQEKAITGGKSPSTEFVVPETLTSHSKLYPTLDSENHLEQPMPKDLDKTPVKAASPWSKSEQRKESSDDSTLTLVNDRSSGSTQVCTSQAKAKYLKFNLPKSVASPQDRVAEFILNSANFMDKCSILEADQKDNSIQPLGKRGNSSHPSAAPGVELVPTEPTKGKQPLQSCVGNKSCLNDTGLSSDLYTTCDEGFDENTSNTAQCDINKQWPHKFVGSSPMKTDQVLPSKLPALSQLDTDQPNQVMKAYKPGWKSPTQMLLDDTLMTLDGSFHVQHPQACGTHKQKTTQLLQQPVLNGKDKVFAAPWESLRYSLTAPKKRISNESIFSTISVKDIVDGKTGLTLVERLLPSDCGSLSDRRSLDSSVTTGSTFSEETQIYDWSMLQTRPSKPVVQQTGKTVAQQTGEPVAQPAKSTSDTPKTSHTRKNDTGKKEPIKANSSPARLNENLKTKTSCLDSEATQAYDWSSIQITSPDTRTHKHLAESCDPSQTSSPVTRSKVELDNNILVPNHLKKLSCEEVSARLKNYGELLGPVTIATKQVYLRRLASLESNPGLVTLTTTYPDYPPEMIQALNGKFDSAGLDHLEMKLIESFNASTGHQWREGCAKSSFTYLLLDPRVTKNLPLRAKDMTDLEVFTIFISAIFYIGKGKRSRPYSHLFEACSKLNKDTSRMGAKVQHILGIWRDGLGVVSLHCFQSVIPVEAYTREACMLEAIGIHKVTNIRKGDFYGAATSWSAQQRRKMGVYLFQKALQIFLAEGERQICIPDLKN